MEFLAADERVQNGPVFRQNEIRRRGDELGVQFFRDDGAARLDSVEGKAQNAVHGNLRDVGKARAFQMFPERHAKILRGDVRLFLPGGRHPDAGRMLQRNGKRLGGAPWRKKVQQKNARVGLMNFAHLQKKKRRPQFICEDVKQ